MAVNHSVSFETLFSYFITELPYFLKMETSHESRQPPEHFDGIRKLIEAKHVDLKSELIRGQTLQDKIQDMTVQMDELNTSITSEVSVPTYITIFICIFVFCWTTRYAITQYNVDTLFNC